MRAQTFINENAENADVHGFRLDGYGLFFDVEVPALQGTLMWSLKTLDQNDLGLNSALKALRVHIDAAGDANLQQALKRIELQVGPMTLGPPISVAAVAPAGTRAATGAQAVAPGEEVAPDSVLTDPREAYRAEVRQQIMDVMLEYGHPLVGVNEWLAVGARSHGDRPFLAPADRDVRTVIIRNLGRDLAAFRANQLSREEALKRMEVRVF